MPIKVSPTDSAHQVQTVDFLKKVSLTPISKGKVGGLPLPAESLWKDDPVVIWIVRRAACAMCRLDGRELSNLFQKQFGQVKLICIIKEIAPESGPITDKEMGVETLQIKYFNKMPVYWDAERKFYEFFGNISMFWQPLSLTPCGIYSDITRLSHRITEAGIDDFNLNVGDIWIKGGILIIGPNEGIVYKHAEMTGSPLPLEDIEQAVWNLIVKYPIKYHARSLESFVVHSATHESLFEI
jgi:hypothetical protein